MRAKCELSIKSEVALKRKIDKSTFIVCFLTLIILVMHLSYSLGANAAAPSVEDSSLSTLMNSLSSASAVLNKPASLAQGDMLMVYVQTRGQCSNYFSDPTWANSLSTTPPIGWSTLYDNKYAGPGLYSKASVFYKYISSPGSEPSSYTFNLSGTAQTEIIGYASLLQLRGTGPNPFAPGSYNVNANASGTADALDVPSVNSQGEALWITSALGYDKWGTVSPSAGPSSPAGFTSVQIDNGAEIAFSIDYKAVSNGATGTAQYSYITAKSNYHLTSLVLCDNSTPLVSGYYPSSGAVYVPRISSVQLTLNKSVSKGSGNIYIKKYSDDSTLLTIPVASADLVIEGNVVKIRLTTCFAAGELVYVVVDPGVFTASCGSSYSGISNKDDFKFYITRACGGMLYNEI